jgi:glyoxylase-like metal-dependent hydrolase (beta-lactamase superfamily II)
MDHFGLAASIRKLAGHFIDCFIHPEDRWRLSSDGFEMEMLGQDASDFMAMAGMPVEEMERIKKRFSSYKALGDPLDEVSAMEDGDEFCQGDFRLKVIHTPGHTPGTCCLYECEQKILFSGDHILKSITPNPFVALNRAHLRDPNYQSLRAYCSSLNKLEDLDVLWAFPGHGEYLQDLRGTISTYRKHHHERMEVVWNALRKEPRPLYYLIGKVFPSVPRDDLFHAISEIFVHLEMLINERKAELVNPGPPALYRAL